MMVHQANKEFFRTAIIFLFLFPSQIFLTAAARQSTPRKDALASVHGIMPMKRSLFGNTKRFSLSPLAATEITGPPFRFRPYHRDSKTNMMALVMRNKSHKRLLSASPSTLSYRLHHCRPAFLRSCPRYSSTQSSMIMKASTGSDNYYAAATSMSTFSTSSTSSLPPPSPDKSFPKWWPVSDSHQTYMTFADHIAHVIVPSSTDKVMDNDSNEETPTSLTCGDVVQWVLRAKMASSQNEESINNKSLKVPCTIITDETDPDHVHRRSRMEAEYTSGEEISADPTKILDPAYRHNPSLLTQTISDTTQPNLIAAELLALGSVWHLPYSSTKSNVDRFDPSNGIKPNRLNAGDANRTANEGDYFRVHFDPRRFVDTNLYDWGNADGIVATDADVGDGDGDGGDGKPGVIVARDDEAGYIIINKPPNIPVHARVDNVLENVASSVGRSLWNERRESILLSHGEEDANDENEKEDELLSSSDINATHSNYTNIARAKYLARKRKRNNRKQKKEQLVYVATPQRLDQNTSGLLVVASKKSFASYFAKLLRTKTSGQLRDQELSSSSRSSSCGVHKSYRCLVCITPQNNNEPGGATTVATTSSMASEIDRLRQYTSNLMKHFLEPSIRSPKRFVPTVPEDAENAESWAECLLRITNITEVCTVVGNGPSDSLAYNLWGDYGKPDGCIAVAECEIELLTGRTHQIRGQLAAEGFPLVGDVQYGGAVPSTSELVKEKCKGRVESFLDSECLALQCCSLEFLDPHHVVKSNGTESVRRSERWNSFRLDSASWTPFVAQYHDESAKISSSEATSSLADEVLLLKQESRADESTTSELPPTVMLSQGTNKYIVIRAVIPENSSSELWFVRSASPQECGGPYHANVAQITLHQLESLGYKAMVVGGGRIDFVENEEISHAHVFGFSYGFGKGDHEKVASIIEQYTDIVATFDNSDGLY